VIVLESVTFGGFLGYVDRFTVPLRSRGLTLIVGENVGRSGSDSNGSGKTTVFDAVTWGLYGETVTGEKTEEVINRLSKKATVRVVLTDEDREVSYRITRTRKKSGGTLEFLQVDDPEDEEGIDLKGSSMSETQEKIDTLLGLDSLAFRTCVLFGQGEATRFASSSTTDAERKRIFRSVMRLEECERARALAAEKKRDLDSRVTTRSTDLRHAQDRLDEIEEDLESAEEKVVTWSEDRDRRLQEVDEEIEDLESSAEDLAGVRKELKSTSKKKNKALDRGEELVRLQGKVDDLDREIREKRSEESEIKSEVSRVKATVGAAESRLLELDQAQEEGRCESCGSYLDSDQENVGFEETRSSTRRLLETSQEALSEVEGSLDTCQGEIEALRGRRAVLRAKMDDLGDPGQEVRDLEKTERRLREEEDRLRGAESEVKVKRESRESIARETNPHVEEVTRLKERRSQARRKVGRLEMDLDRLREELALASFWVKGWGSKGIQSFAIDHALPKLSAASQEYLTTLSGGDLEVDFDSVSKTKKGEVRDTFRIIPRVEGDEGLKISGGQKTRIELSTSFGLSDLVAERESASIDCYFLDEVFDALDQTGKDRLIDLLRLLRSRRSTILAVSHDPDVVRHFDRVIRVQRKDKVSRIVEGAE